MSALDEALRYEALGWSVIPIMPGSKKPAIDWKQYQTKRAPTDQIKWWWGKDHTYNLGVVCGRISGLVVFDFDTKTKVPDAIAIGKIYPNGPMQRTGSGGLQVFFKHPGHEVKTDAGVYNPDTRGDIDIRADGGYVVVPPSLHPSGINYEWLRDPAGEPMDMTPDWTPRRDDQTRKVTGPDWLRDSLMQPVPPGQRNATLTRMCGALYKKGLDEDLIRALLEPWWRRNHRDEIKRGEEVMREMDATVASIGRAARRTTQGTMDDGLSVVFGPVLSGRPPEWVVPGLVMAGSVQAVVGSPRAGKSWLTLMLANSVANGTPFLDRDVKQGRVLVAHEDSMEMVTQRVGRIAGGATKLHDNLGIVSNQKGDRTKFLDFKTPEAQKRSFEFLESVVQRYKPSLMVFDALYRMVNLHDYAAEAPQQLDPLVRIAREHNVAVVIVHHSTKSGSENAGLTGVGGWGSIFLDAFLEGGWNLKREFEEPGNFIIRMITDFKSGQGAQYRLRLTIEEHAVRAEQLEIEQEGGAMNMEPVV